MVLQECDFDDEYDLQELEKLLEESEYNELKKAIEDPPWRGNNATMPWHSDLIRFDEQTYDTTMRQYAHNVVSEQKPKIELKE